MTEQAKYDALKTKLDNLCKENRFSYMFNHDDYPITMVIRPLQGMYDQISFLEAAEDGKGRISQDATYKFIKKDGDISWESFGQFAMSDELHGKFKNIFKKMSSLWEQYFFRTVMETQALKYGYMPVIDESEDDQKYVVKDVGELHPEDAEESLPGDEPDHDFVPDEELVRMATEVVRLNNKATISLLQRNLQLGYSDASVLMDELEKRGIVGPYKGSSPREVMPYAEPET